jgi:hypothetical protein
MDKREMFKFAFLMECARDGLSEAETRARIRELEVAMTSPIEKRAVVDQVVNALRGILHVGIPTAIGGAALTGAGAGFVAAKLREGAFDADAAKKQELIAAYNSFSDQARSNAEAKRRGATIRLPL